MRLYRAVVEDNDDPVKIGRVKVRIHGLHTAANAASGLEFGFIGSEALPWAEVMGSTGFGLVSGVGLSSVLRKGTWVWVMLENDNPNKPVVMGVLIGKNSADPTGAGFGDPDGVYPKTSALPDPSATVSGSTVTAAGGAASRATRSDMHPLMDADYLNTTVIETPAGDIIKMDANEFKIAHHSGTSIVIGSDGTVKVTTVKDTTITAAANVTMNVGADFLCKTGGKTTFESAGNFKVTAPRIDLN